jgi:acetyl esterase/lipase
MNFQILFLPLSGRLQVIWKKTAWTLLFMALLIAQNVQAQQVIPIWSGTKVHAPEVTLTAYLPEHGNGTAVIICPGGSYCWLSKTVEGTDVAKRLNELGVAAYVLHYRTAGWAAFAWHTRFFGGGHHHPYPIQDLQRAIQLVRERAAANGIISSRVGVMGFSAGGHLALLSAETRTDYLLPLGIRSTVSLSPSFIAPIYPVVSMSAPCTHKRSRRGLLGEHKKWNRLLQDSLSMEKHTDRIQCPVFLLNCKDDPIVKDKNSVLLDSALTTKKIPHIYLHYEKGGHGFGTGAKISGAVNGWIDKWTSWMQKMKLIAE